MGTYRATCASQAKKSTSETIVVVITMVVLQLLFTYAPAMQRVLGTEDLSGTEWVQIIAVGAGIYSVVGIEKCFQRRA